MTEPIPEAQCRWLGCVCRFADSRDLERHLVVVHLQPLSSEMTSGRERVCLWAHCQYPPHEFLEVQMATLTRHVKFHAFIEHLLQRSFTITTTTTVSCHPAHACSTTPASTHLTTDHRCPCGAFSTDSILGLLEHFTSCTAAGVADAAKRVDSFACPSCLRTFRYLRDLGGHHIQRTVENLTARKSRLFCGWLACWSKPEGFDTLLDLQQHLLQCHLSSPAVCFWMECPAPGNMNRAHLLLHAFSAQCCSTALDTVENMSDFFGRRRCQTARHNWLRDRLQDPAYSGLQCRWANCLAR